MRDWREDFFEDGKLYILLTKGEKEGEREGSREKLRGRIVCAAGYGGAVLPSVPWRGAFRGHPGDTDQEGCRRSCGWVSLRQQGRGRKKARLGCPFSRVGEECGHAGGSHPRGLLGGAL